MGETKGPRAVYDGRQPQPAGRGSVSAWPKTMIPHRGASYSRPDECTPDPVAIHVQIPPPDGAFVLDRLHRGHLAGVSCKAIRPVRVAPMTEFLDRRGTSSEYVNPTPDSG